MRTDDGYVEWLMRRYGIPRAEAEDILQASLLRLVHDYCAKHPDANETELQAYLDTPPEGVLYQTLHWQACNWLRARRREQTMLACWMQQRPCEDDPEQAAVERVYAEWLASLLPDGAREIHALLEAGYTWDETATQLGVRPSAAKMRFQRGVAQVRQQLGLGCDDLAVCGVNKDGGRKTGVAPTQSQMEVHDEESSEMADGQLERVDRCEHGGSAVAPCRPQRTRRGGGKIDHEFCGGCSQILPKLSPDQIRHLVGKQVSKTSGAQRDEEWVVSPNQVGVLPGLLPPCSNPIGDRKQEWCEAPSIFSICWWRGLNIKNMRTVCFYRGNLFCCGRWQYVGCDSCPAGPEPLCFVPGRSRCACTDCP